VQGRCVLVSVVDADIPLPGLDMVLRQKEIIGTISHSAGREFSWALQYLSDGRVDVEPIITDRVYLGEAVEKGFARLRDDRSQIKILVTPHREWVSQKE
jgi:(R,R)-butanediol dehydrogenase/meso-butanediol dehydrogenase/diacetyl reductase